MRTYPDLTSGLQAVLLHRQRGYVTVTKNPVIVPADKVDSIASKWIDAYGINLPRWKRAERKSKGLPNAVALDIPILGDPYKRQIVLMCTKFEAKELHAESPFLREQWTEDFSIQCFKLSVEKRTNGTDSDTWKLKDSVIKPLAHFWIGEARKQEWPTVMNETKHAVNLYPMFLGVRNQLKREISGIKKLYEKKTEREWPGVDPLKLPIISGFRGAKAESEVKNKRSEKAKKTREE